jgi:hypothetical protein
MRLLRAVPFLWKDIMFSHHFRGVASCKPHTGDTAALLWHDVWNNHYLKEELPRLYSFARNKSISVQAYAANPEAHSANIARTTTTHSHNAGSRHLWRAGHTCGDDPANTRQGSSTQFHSRPCSHQHFLGGYGNQNAATRSKNPPVDRVNTRNTLVY